MRKPRQRHRAESHHLLQHDLQHGVQIHADCASDPSGKDWRQRLQESANSGSSGWIFSVQRFALAGCRAGMASPGAVRGAGDPRTVRRVRVVLGRCDGASVGELRCGRAVCAHHEDGAGVRNRRFHW